MESAENSWTKTQNVLEDVYSDCSVLIKTRPELTSLKYTEKLIIQLRRLHREVIKLMPEELLILAFFPILEVGTILIYADLTSL
jgi:hypothetical protein